jgi:hypothetical protein
MILVHVILFFCILLLFFLFFICLLYYYQHGLLPCESCEMQLWEIRDTYSGLKQIFLRAVSLKKNRDTPGS